MHLPIVPDKDGGICTSVECLKSVSKDVRAETSIHLQEGASETKIPSLNHQLL